MSIFPIQRFTISGSSMLPTLKPGQDILVLCWFYKLQAGDMVVIKIGDKEMVKRVQKLHDRKIFVEGDNKKKSIDSRDFGEVNMNQIIGKVVSSF